MINNVISGKWYDAIEAERRGLTNRLQGLYINPITSDTMSIRKAIERGLIKADVSRQKILLLRIDKKKSVIILAVYKHVTIGSCEYN